MYFSYRNSQQNDLMESQHISFTQRGCTFCKGNPQVCTQYLSRRRHNEDQEVRLLSRNDCLCHLLLSITECSMSGNHGHAAAAEGTRISKWQYCESKVAMYHDIISSWLKATKTIFLHTFI